VTADGSFDAVVFAGGGCRCFWQLGFWSVAAPALQLRPRMVSAVSAGCAMACAALLDRCQLTLDHFMAATARNPKNVYPWNLLRTARAPTGALHSALQSVSPTPRVFPHHAMYREAILAVVDAAGLERLRSGPELRMVLARPPAGLGPHLSLLLGLGCYVVERRTGDPVHTQLARRLGFGAEAVSGRRCRSPEELADLVLASSCTPPFTPVLRWDGRTVLDGSLAHSAPVCALDHPGRTLILLSRHYGTAPRPDSSRVYLAPSSPVPVSKWDYTSPQLLQQTYDLGRRDAEAFVAVQ